MRISTNPLSSLALAAALLLVARPGDVVQAESSRKSASPLGLQRRSRPALQAVVTSPPPLARRDPTATPTSSSHSTEALSLLRGGAVENTLANAIAGSVVMALIEKAVKKLFHTHGISFPAPLGGCLLLFLSLLLTERISPEVANALFTALSPGAGFLAKWLPVFFVPGLAMLPLAPSVGGPTEVAKVILVAGLGFLYTLFTTGFSVLLLRQAQGAVAIAPSAKAPAAKNAARTAPKAAKPAAAAAPKPFGDDTLQFFVRGSVAFGVASLVATRSQLEWATPLQTLFLGFATVAAYVWGARLPTDFTKVVHPLVTSCALLLSVVYGLGVVTDRSFSDVLRSYKVGSLDLHKAGAGDVLLYLLGPSVVSFAISMYSRRQLLFANLPVVALAMLVSSVGGLVGTAAFVRAIALGGKHGGGAMVRLSVLARNVTTALAIALTQMLGGDISIAASVVVLTGILGATYGKALLSRFRITDPITRGLAIGSSSQGLGVASISDEPDAFPFAAISMVLTAISATTLVSIPAVRDFIVQLATGV